MRKLLLLFLMVLLLWPTLAWSQKSCTRVTSTSQNCVITATWVGSVVDATHDAPTNYIVRRSDGGGAMTEIGKVAATTMSFQNTFTDPGNTAHCWDVVATNSSGSSIPATQDCWTTPAINAAPPNAPGGVTIASISSTGLRITWDDVETEASYQVMGRTAKGNQKFAQLVSLPAQTTTWDWTSRRRYTSYCIALTASNDAGSSPLSETHCATTSK